MKSVKKIMIAVGITIMALVPATVLFMQQPAFGKDPKGARLERIKQSPNYRDGAFQNEHLTPMLPEGRSYRSVMWEFFFKKEQFNVPPAPIPTVRTDLKSLEGEKPVIVWFGHSSYLIKAKGHTILVDPVFSGHASPVAMGGTAFKGSNAYDVDDMPDIDVCIITHDHYDHLDYHTIRKLHPKVKHFYTALGVGSHLEGWGIDTGKIVELDWWEGHTSAEGIEITATPARHFSGRGFVRNKSLWASYVININGYKIYAGGDSGYDTHFKKIGEKFGQFDIVMLECGQYGKDWPLIHMTPEETAQAAKDLNTKMLLPVHWGKFALALHTWNAPISRLAKATTENGVKITTPLIGEPVVLDGIYPNKVWWNF